MLKYEISENSNYIWSHSSRIFDWTQFLFYFKNADHYQNFSQTENSDPNDLQYTASKPTTVEIKLNSN